MDGLLARVTRAVKTPSSIPRKLLFRWRRTPYYATWAARKWSVECPHALRARLAVFGSSDADPDRFAPIFQHWPEGLPDIEGRVLDADWYECGSPRMLPLPEDLPEPLRDLVLRPALGSSKEKLLPTMFAIAKRARSVFEAGYFTGVSSTAFLLGLSGDGAFVGTDILPTREADLRLSRHLSPTRILFHGPVGAVQAPFGAFDVIFLDMVHELPVLAPTLDRVLPWLAPGGVLIVDDIGFEGSIYTPESLRAHLAALERGAPRDEIPALVGAPSGYRDTIERGHLAVLRGSLARRGGRFREFHVPDGGGTVFLWHRPQGQTVDVASKAPTK